MAIRVVPDDVRRIIDTVKDDDAISFHIEVANGFTNYHLADSTAGEPILRLVELYLTAHFLAISDPSDGKGQIVREEIEGTSNYYNTKLGEGLSSTRYGLQAVALDSSGVLATLAKYRARFEVVTGYVNQ